jgi:ABC-type multidrug transport system fused ATPase/permease subunit
MHIALADVSFAYANRPDFPVLSRLSLTIPAGRVTALVGPSGAGKSTVAALLNGLYEPTSGAIRVDGVGRARAGGSNDAYLRRVSVVRQAPALFTDTVANNIAYGAVAYRPVSQGDIERAAQLANADEFIRRLPLGYETMLGDGAGYVQLSGGQKQRIAIARALLKNASLLILDEATSALDAESEALVQDALGRLIEGRTTVVIAHRLSTVINADQIAFVKDGTVAEVGTHESLMARKGLYYGLMSMQMSGYDEAGTGI